jgi:Lon protease-like protein
MDMEIVLPDEVAVMTLPGVAFFPQALMPLHIFEPRYRQMLKEVLASHRLFAVTGLNPKGDPAAEPPQRVATIGIVRACQKSENGTSTLLLQGLARVEVLKILRETPYRAVRIRPLASRAGAEADENLRLRRSLARLLSMKQRLGGQVPAEFAQFLRTVSDPEIFVDLAAFTLCEQVPLK